MQLGALPIKKFYEKALWEGSVGRLCGKALWKSSVEKQSTGLFLFCYILSGIAFRCRNDKMEQTISCSERVKKEQLDKKRTNVPASAYTFRAVYVIIFNDLSYKYFLPGYYIPQYTLPARFRSKFKKLFPENTVGHVISF